MAVKQRQYKEGQGFGIALGDMAYAMGLVARGSERTKVLFGYFFGPFGAEPPTIADLKCKSPQDAILSGMFGDSYLHKGRWPLLGQLEQWNREDWPFGPCGRVDLLIADRAYKTWYSDDDPRQMIREVICTPADIIGLPKDGIMGAALVEARLKKLLA